MANINYTDLTLENANSGDYKVGFFGIKNGEEAIVRFAINSLNDFELYTVHPITVGQSSYPNRRISCLRNNPKTDTINMCPLCAKGEKVQQRMYIKMIQYVNENGQIVPKAVIWDRPAYSYAPQLKSYLDNYGPLSNIVCKIVRHGDGLDTKYDIIPNLNPQIFNEQLYPKNFSDFNDFQVLGRMVMNKTYDEIVQFINTGNFPQVTKQSAAYPGNEPSPMTSAEANYVAQTVPDWAPVQDTVLPNNVPTDVPVMNRPVRYY